MSDETGIRSPAPGSPEAPGRPRVGKPGCPPAAETTRPARAGARPRRRRTRASGGRSCGAWRDARADLDELSFDFAIFKPIERSPGDQHQIVTRRHAVLMVAEDLAQTPFGPCPLDRRTDGGGGCHHTNPAKLGRNHRFPRRNRRARLGTTAIPKRKTAAFEAAAPFTNGPDIALAPQVLLGAETHGRSRNQTTVNRLRPLRRRERSTLRPPAVALRARKPIWRARFLRCGRKVGCMTREVLRGD